jgi:hypothetical protein
MSESDIRQCEGASHCLLFSKWNNSAHTAIQQGSEAFSATKLRLRSRNAVLKLLRTSGTTHFDGVREWAFDIS